MKKYIYTLYGTIVVTLLLVIIASAHNIYVGHRAEAKPNAMLPEITDDSLSLRFTFRSDSVPVMNYIPLQGPQYTSLDTLFQDAPQLDGSNATDHRQENAFRAAFAIDSLIATRSFAFYPSVMQAGVGQPLRNIYHDYYYLYLSPVDLEVHIPVEHLPSAYLTMLNFSADSIADYHSRKQLSEWIVTFSATNSGEKYDFQLVISTITAEAELIVLSPQISMRYLGSVGSRKDMHQSRAAKFFQELGRTNPAATN